MSENKKSIREIKEEIKDIVAQQVSELNHLSEFKKDHAAMLKSFSDTLKNLKDIEEDKEKNWTEDKSTEELEREFE